jgi:hypothetical protein
MGGGGSGEFRSVGEVVFGFNGESCGSGRAGSGLSAIVGTGTGIAGCRFGTLGDFTSVGAGAFGFNGEICGSGRAGSGLSAIVATVTGIAGCTMLGTSTNDFKTGGFFSAGRKIV